jgi:hypothetical protein
MSARTLVSAIVLLLLAAATAISSDETWYDVRQQYGADASYLAQQQGQIQEIEVAPGVRVLADIWDDDHVPTYEELVSIGFLADDARELSNQMTTWGMIKICMSSPDPEKCFGQEKDNG